MTSALTYADEQSDRFISDLIALLRIPTVSTDPAYAEDVSRGAEWLADHLREIGVEHVEVVRTEGHPIVYAEHLPHDDRPTVLVYGHYDVQPPDPVELWNSPPFEPTRKNGTLYARGACDDKGQLMMHVKALQSYLATGSEPPVNLKFLVEGEEECGSPSLAPFIEKHQEKLAADVVAISDTAMFAEGMPSITYGLRGLAYVQVELTGPNRDLHSGIYGGAVENPANVLSQMIADLHDDDHRVTVEGFYDDVIPLTAEERETFAALPFDEGGWLGEVGLTDARTEAGYSMKEAISARPTLDVNGLWSGYQGQGAKTVLPSKAGAKISCRLVPGQNPHDITQKLRRHFERHIPDTVTLSFAELHGGQPVLIDTSHPAMQAAADAIAAVFDREPVFTREGGSIPIVAEFQRLLGLDSVLMGFGLNSDAIHSPNEHFGLGRYAKGIQSIIRFQQAYADQEAA